MRRVPGRTLRPWSVATPGFDHLTLSCVGCIPERTRPRSGLTFSGMRSGQPLWAGRIVIVPRCTDRYPTFSGLSGPVILLSFGQRRERKRSRVSMMFRQRKPPSPRTRGRVHPSCRLRSCATPRPPACPAREERSRTEPSPRLFLSYGSPLRRACENRIRDWKRAILVRRQPTFSVVVRLSFGQLGRTFRSAGVSLG